MRSKPGVRLLVGEVFGAYRENAAPLLRTAVVIFVPILLLFELVAADSRDTATGLMFSFSGPATFLYAGMVAPLIAGETSEVQDGSIGALWKAAVPTVPPMLLAGVLYTVGTTVGVMLLVVPGLVLMTYWAVTPAVVRLERAGAVAALGRSWRLIRGRAWTVFGVVIAVAVTALAISMLISLIVLALAGEESAAVVGAWLGLVVAVPLIGLAPLVLYRHLSDGSETERRSDDE